MEENNQQEPSIDELISQGEEGERKPKSFFKKPVVVVGIILALIILTAFIFITREKYPAPLTEEDKRAQIEQRVKGSIPPITEEEKSQIQQKTEDTQTPQLTPEEKSEIERRIMGQ